MKALKIVFNIFKHLFMPLTALIVLLISVLQVVGVAYCDTNSWDVLFLTPDDTINQIISLAKGIYIFLIVAYIWLDHKKETSYKSYNPVLFIIAFTIIFLSWLEGIIINYPGSFGTDALRQLNGAYGYIEFMDDNPLHTLLMKFFFSIGDMFGNRTAGAFSYTLFQAILLALAFAFMCEEVRRITPEVCGGIIAYSISLAFFAMSPMWGAFAQWISKDIPYTAVISMWMVFLMRCIRDGENQSKYNIIMMIITAVISCLMRINGPFAIFPTMFALVIFSHKNSRKYIFTAFLVTVVLYAGSNKILRIKVDEQAAQRDITLLGLVQLNQAQQVMRCYIEHPESITPEEVEIIDAVLETDRINEMYNPTSTDGILYIRRATTYEAIGKFQKLWVDFLKRYPDSCIQASLNKCYGYYSCASMGYISLHGHDSVPDSRLELNFLYPEEDRNAYKAEFEEISRAPVTRVMSMAGLYTQISIICGWSLLRKFKIKELIPFIPIAINICVCLAGPLSKFIRYALPVAAACPLLIAWVAETLKSLTKIPIVESDANQ